MAKTPRDIPGKAQTIPKAKTTSLTVEAVNEMGYYDYARRRVGDVFVIEATDFSPRWMQRVPEETPLQVTTAQQALRQQHRETVAAKAQPSMGIETITGRAHAPTTGTDRDVL